MGTATPNDGGSHVESLGVHVRGSLARNERGRLRIGEITVRLVARALEPVSGFQLTSWLGSNAVGNQTASAR